MKRILVINSDTFFAEFITQYFNASGFRAVCTYNNVEGFAEAARNIPNLIIASKESPFLDIKGFLIKKRLAETLKDIPLFLVGDFSPAEIREFQKDNVMAFLSKRLNPRALVERVHHQFDMPLPENQHRTPMILDLHTKGNIFIAQIEGNFDPVNLVIMNFLLRMFFKSRKIKKPHIMLIIPSIYSETITNVNLDYLFDFVNFKEFDVDPQRVQILTNIKELRSLIKESPKFSKFVFAIDYVNAFKELMVDFNLETVIPLDFMKKGNVFALDIYDNKGNVVVPALTEVTAELIQELRERGLKKLKYYSDIDITKTGIVSGINMNAAVFDYITREFTPISTDAFDMNILNQKQNLFFSKIKGQNMVVITHDEDIQMLIRHSLGEYFSIIDSKTGAEIDTMMQDEAHRISIVFIDLRDKEEDFLEVMKAIREKATRRKTTIILLASKVNKVQLVNYMSYGTDHVILFPFTTTKIYNKVYTSVLHDRET
ncbi:MAG: hypothetical protein JW874_14770 [Spirochaetales bacterium]|nr:hypothetical protein [Spirochaetales bacterium]